MRSPHQYFALLTTSFVFMSCPQAVFSFQVGSGIADITGPTIGVQTLGYASPTPIGTGLQQRLWSRAFVIADGEKFVNIAVNDLCFISIAIKQSVIKELQRLYPNDGYTDGNVMLSATHTHTGPGGISHYGFYNQPTKGMVIENFAHVVQGIVHAINQARQGLQPASINYATGLLTNASRNRSLLAYEKNPKDERDFYNNSVEERTQLLKFIGENGAEIGLMHWFAVHATSINKHNTLITGDNKGYAAAMFEKSKAQKYWDDRGFVAAFANGAAGDASPNIAGDIDNDGDWECDLNENFACAKQIGDKMYQSAHELYNEARTEISGSIDYRLSYLNFVDYEIPDTFLGRISGMLPPVKTCYGAMGISMLAGSLEDGSGVGREGINCSTGQGILVARGCNRKNFPCQGEKPVILATGRTGETPQILPVQIFRIGSLAIVGVPGEFTAMSGRRVRKMLAPILANIGVDHLIINGYSNAFASYVATPEEYQLQHYEGASTQFGENTLVGYMHELSKAAGQMVTGTTATSNVKPPDLSRSVKTVHMPTGGVQVPRNSRFGEVVTQPRESYKLGKTVEVIFWASHPNHSVNAQHAFFEIQEKQSDQWVTVADDQDWYTSMTWKRDLGSGVASIKWIIPQDGKSGEYRVRYVGYAQSNLRSRFEGFSRVFKVEN